MAPANAQTLIKSSGSRAHNQKKSSRARNGTIIPIIKIVHVYAPTLVRTDVAHFRALVQEMTGNDGAASHNIEGSKAVCSMQASTDDEAVMGAANPRTSKAQACMHMEGASSTSSGVSVGVQGGKRERRTYAAYVSEEEGEVCCEYGDMESSCEQSVDSFFAESELEVCLEDHLCKVQPQPQPQQMYCGAYFATRSLQEIPGGFESFDCC